MRFRLLSALLLSSSFAFLGCSKSHPPSLLGAPSAVTVSAGAIKGQLIVAWQATPGATGYAVSRSPVSGSGYEQIGAADAAATSYIDATAPAGVTSYYVVRAQNAAGLGAASAEASALTGPTAPAGLSATASASGISLSWTASAGASKYNIYRSATSGSGYGALATATTTSAVDATGANATTYYFVVRAVDDAGESDASAEATATTLPALPPAPANLVATPGVASVALAWDATAGASSYAVFRSSGSGLAQIAAPATNGYADASLPPNTSYSYAVAAINVRGQGAKSAVVAAITAPAAPVLSADAGDNRVSLSWAPVDGAALYLVYRGNALLATQAATAYTDSTAVNGTAYSYTVAAKNSVGTTGAASAAATATPAAPIVDAANYAASNGSTGLSPGQQFGELIPVSTGGKLLGLEFALSRYHSSPGTSTRLRVYNGQFQVLGSATISYDAIPASPPTLSPTITQSGYFDLSAQNIKVSASEVLRAVLDTSDGGFFGGGQSPRVSGAAFSMTYGGNAWPNGDLNFKSLVQPSTAVSAPGAPLAHLSVGQVDLYWTASPGAQSYKIQRRTSGGTAAEIGSAQGTSYSDATVTPGTAYLYSIRAVGASSTATSGETAATAARAVVDQSNLFRSNGGMTCTSSQRYGQAFTVAIAGTLVGIEARLNIMGQSTQHAGNVILKLFDAGGTLLTTVQRPVSDLDGGDAAPLDPRYVGTGYFDLSSAKIAVTAGQRLSFELSTDTDLTHDPKTWLLSGLALTVGSTQATTDGTSTGPLVYSGGSMTQNGSPYTNAFLQFKTFVQ